MDEPSVERETMVPAPPEEVWRSLTDPERMKEWLGTPNRIEPCPGGDLDIELPGGDRRSGFFEELTEGERLVFWWSRETEEASRVEIELDDLGDSTRVRVVESRPLSAPFPRAEARAMALA
jgi:uncharacterized protein YndB with AHSA1/START domain